MFSESVMGDFMKVVVYVIVAVCCIYFRIAGSEGNSDNPSDRYKIFSVISQEEINYQIIPPDADNPQLGAIPIAIMSHYRVKEAEDEVARFRNMLIDYDYTSELHSSIESTLREIFGDDNYEYIRTEDPELIYAKPRKYKKYKKTYDKKSIPLSNNETLIVLDTTYSFNSKFQVIHIIINGHYFKKGKGNYKKYKKEQFRIVSQSKARDILYTNYSEEDFSREFEAARKIHQKRIDSAGSHNKKEQLKRREKAYLREFKKRYKYYVKLSEPRKNEDWNRDNIVESLGNALENASTVLRFALDDVFFAGNNKSNREDYGVGVILARSKRDSIQGTKVQLLDKNELYIFFKDIFWCEKCYFSVPKNEPIWIPQQ